MKHKLIILSISFLSLQSLSAQETRNITLHEAVDLGLKNSKLLKLNEAKIREAAANVKEAEEHRLPEASVSASYLYLPIKPVINLKGGSDTSGGSGGPNVNQAMYGMLNASLPLYTGGKLKYGIQSAQYLEQAIKLDADNDHDAVVFNIVNACINLFKAHQAISLVKENLEQSQQRVKDFTNLERNGLIPRNDLLKVELQSSNIELTLLDAESNYKVACVNMNIMMGLPEQTILIPDKTGLELPTTIKTIDEYEQDAIQNRKDINAIALRKKAADLGIKIAKSDRYPSIALTAGYVAADIPKFLTVYNAVNVGVGVKYNIASLWKNKTKIQQAEARIKQVEANKDILNDNIRLQINQTYQNYLVSVKKIEVYEKSVLQATENYRITKNKYDNALSTTTELLDADVALLQAKLSVTNAKADSFLAYNRLLQAAGILNDAK
ncbi:TolC family protein [Ferruginibacter lapsinanis]|uniref:TolC family protein n=1 Tax=Ferruginibacter lapsinanis TaxID=563172 RepID=UPI001E3DCBCD|nr:TolC family protein [Ferruginibacter lapsinanis]UEG50933.1 TolC family protein [Ferruginibacter lapsinanis]